VKDITGCWLISAHFSGMTFILLIPLFQTNQKGFVFSSA
jgi:hypothetical protein